MILRSLRATHFKKFREISLDDLPSRGLIGIVGPNESGKSTVVDAITFALWGRTAASDAAGLQSLIHWEEELCQVEIVIDLPGTSSYRLFREIDRMGDHLAQLERLDGGERPADVSRAVVDLSLAGARAGRVVSGSLRVAKELRRLLGYTYDDFRDSFYLAQQVSGAPTRDGGAPGAAGRPSPDWRGVLLRMTGIDRLERAIHRAEGVSDSIGSEIRQVDDELRVQGRVLAAIGVGEEDEAALRRDIEDLERRLAGVTGEREAARRRLDAARQRAAARGQAARELGRLAVAELREQIATQAAGLALGLGRRRQQLAAERDAVVAQRDAARRRCESVAGLRQMLDELGSRLEERRRLLDAQLAAGTAESLVDERAHLSGQVRAQARRGRLATVSGSVLLAPAVAVAIWLAVGTPAVPLSPPLAITAAQLQAGAIGLAILGLVLMLVGMRGRGRGRQMIASHRVRLEECDQTLAHLMSEREILGREAIEIARDPRAARIDDERIHNMIKTMTREHRGFLDRQLTIDDYAGELRREADDTEIRLRHLDATAERLQRLTQTAGGLAADLRRWVRGTPRAAAVDQVELGTLEETLQQLKQRSGDVSRRLEGDERAVSDRLAVPRQLVDELGAEARVRLAELENYLSQAHGGEAAGAPERPVAAAAPAASDAGRAGKEAATRSAVDLERRLVQLVDAVLSALPGEQELDTAVQDASARCEEQERRLAELRTRRDSRVEEQQRLKPQFDRRRTVEEEIQALAGKAEDLKVELAREQGAARLLRGTADRVRSRLAPAIGRALGRRLGHITGGRYSRVSLDADFGIHIFSDERNAFVDPVELSGGTHGQLLLSLRLAFAEVLLAARGRGTAPHLLLLDEPLDGFDAERARRFVTLMRTSQSPLAQVFLLGNQEHLAGDCDVAVRTTIASAEIHARSGGTPAGAARQERGANAGWRDRI